MSWIWYKGRQQPAKTVKNWNAPLPESQEWRLEALYAWERLLRGYELYPAPVALEPSFIPYDPAADAREGGWESVPQPRDGRDGAGGPMRFLALRLPVEQKVTPAGTSDFLGALRHLRHPFSLELIADCRSIRYQIGCTSSDAAVIAACGHSFPLAHVEMKEGDALLNALSPLAEFPAAHRVVDFGLYHPAYRPLPLFESFAGDPHMALLGVLGSLDEGEVAGVQLLVAPAQGGWASSLALLVDQFDGVAQAAHPNTRENELERGLRYKLGSPLWAVAARVFAITADCGSGRLATGHGSEHALNLCRQTGGVLSEGGGEEWNHDQWNHLVALDDSGYAPRERLRDLLDRRSRRAGMLLSQAELAGLWHPPSERLVHPRLVRHDPRHRELPSYLQGAPGAALGLLSYGDAGHGKSDDGKSGYGMEPQLVPWPDAMRPRHLYMLGATRMGKSTLLLNMIAQDLLAGRGLCLIDPHGDLALDVLRRVPPEREADVLYLDLSDTAHPPALGLLEASDEWEKRLLVSDLLAILHRLFRASWGDRLEHILRHVLLTLLAAQTSPLGTPLTLRDIRPLLSSKAYREQLLERVDDLDLRTFWHSEFPGYASAAFAPVYNKLGLLLSSPIVRNIIGGGESRLHAGPLMRERRVLVVNLAQSLIGEDNAHFLGALLVSKIQLAAMHNLRLGREERSPFTLYVDEFQNFVVSSFEKILSEAGKAGLTLVMANQFLEQLGENLPTAIRSNAGTLVSFRVSAQSGRALEGEFGGLFGAKELVDLERGQAVARIGRAGDSFLIHTFPPLQPETLGSLPGAAERIRSRTQSLVCRERAEVEAELRLGDEALHRLLEEVAQQEKGAQAKKESRETKNNNEKKIAKPRQPITDERMDERADEPLETEDAASPPQRRLRSRQPRHRSPADQRGPRGQIRLRSQVPAQQYPLSGRGQTTWVASANQDTADDDIADEPEVLAGEHPPSQTASSDPNSVPDERELSPKGRGKVDTPAPLLFFGLPDEPEQEVRNEGHGLADQAHSRP
jgi:hypothetical protein